MPDFVAFQTASSASGIVASTVTIGKDFDCVSAAVVTGLGVFDPGGSIAGTVTISIFDRTSPASPVATATVTGTAGVTLAGHRVVTITPVTLAAGFQGSVVVSSTATLTYGSVSTTDDTGGGLLSIAYPPDLYRYDTGNIGNAWPNPASVNFGSVNNPNNVAVGTFTYHAVGSSFKPIDFPLLAFSPVSPLSGIH